MSTPTPGPSRRRRIAGERRIGRPGTPGAEETSADEEVAPRPKPPKAPRTPRPPKPPRTPRTGSSAGGWWGSPASLVVLAGVLALGLVVGSLLALGLLGNRGIDEVREAGTTDDAGLAASASAERAATAILAYDYNSLDSDQATAQRFMTPTFSAKYAKTFEKVVKPAAADAKAKVTAEVKGSSVVRAAPDRVRVLLFVDQTTVSTANEGPQRALNRVELDMVQRAGSWFVDDITSY